MNFLITSGYSLKKRALLRWIYKHNLSQPYVAHSLGMSTYEFKRKLYYRQKFSQMQIRKLVYLMGARDAFFVIYFPSPTFRREVYFYVFGRELNTGRYRRYYERK